MANIEVLKIARGQKISHKKRLVIIDKRDYCTSVTRHIMGRYNLIPSLDRVLLKRGRPGLISLVVDRGKRTKRASYWYKRTRALRTYPEPYPKDFGVWLERVLSGQKV